jgi:hypothetical protein
MARSRYLFFWVVAIPACWLCAYRWTFRMCPIFVDGGGMMPSFHFGGYGSAWGSIENVLWAYRLVASICTLAICLPAMVLCRRWPGSRTALFFASLAGSLALLVAAGEVLYWATEHNRWTGAWVFRAASFDDELSGLVQNMKLLLPLSAIGGGAGARSKTPGWLTGCESDLLRRPIRSRSPSPAAPSSSTPAAGSTPPARSRSTPSPCVLPGRESLKRGGSDILSTGTCESARPYAVGHCSETEPRPGAGCPSSCSRPRGPARLPCSRSGRYKDNRR